VEDRKEDLSRIPITPGAPPSTIESQEEQQIQPIRNKAKVKIDSYWSQSLKIGRKKL
jgi:hypothetical protein